jgi:outer membrane protein assembly factor BamB
MRLWLATFILLLSGMGQARADFVYVSRDFSKFGTVDLTTGVYSEIGTTSQQLNALTFAPNGTLYGIGANDHLYQVNTATAALTDVGATGTFFALNGLAARGDGTLFGEDPFGNLYRVDATTATATSVGPSGVFGISPNGMLAFGPADTLFLDVPNFLYTVNQSTGTATKSGAGPLGANLNGGLVFSGSQGFAFDFFGEIYQINTGAGTASDTHVAVFGGFGPVHGAAAAPTPEPASLTLCGIGAAGLVCYAWRRRRSKA